jgi:hypothetical protein
VSERAINIRAPLAGVVRRTSFQDQPPYALFDARDFLPFDYKTGRERLAIRPGWVSYGSHNNTNLIATLNVAPLDTPHQRILITADGGNLYSWSGESTSLLGSGITTGRNVQSAPYVQELFIANDGVPKVYKHASGTLVDWVATEGDVPEDCRLICEWANRIVLAAPPDNPNAWFMSRIDDPYDFLFAEDDTASAVASSDIVGGQISEPITSLIPHNRDCIILGTANSLRVWRGNPVDGGYLESIAHVTGPVNGTAWCKTADDWTYLLTRDGLYKMPPGCGTNPTKVSREIIPESLLAIDGVNNKAFLAYDVRFCGIHIYVTGDSPEYWYFDAVHGGFWPFSVPGASILAIGRHDPIETADESGVLVGTSTGLKRLDRTAPLGGNLKAYAHTGPFRLESMLGRKSMVRRTVYKFGENTNDFKATIDFYGAENAEAVTSLPTGRKHRVTYETLAANHNSTNPRIGGQAGLIAINQVNTQKHISFEMATLFAGHTGQERG